MTRAPDLTELTTTFNDQQLSHNAELQALQAIYTVDYPWLADLAELPSGETAPAALEQQPGLVVVSGPSYRSHTSRPLMVQAPPLLPRLGEKAAAAAAAEPRHKQMHHPGSKKAMTMKPAQSDANGCQSGSAQQKKPDARTGQVHQLRDRNGRFLKSLQRSPPPARGKQSSLLRRKSSSLTTNSHSPPPPNIGHTFSLKLPLPSELVTLIYKCCILPCIMLKPSSKHAKSCRKQLFFRYIRPQLINYFTSSSTKSYNSYKSIDALFANALRILGF